MINPGFNRVSDATYTNKIDPREFYMNGIFSRQVVLHILEKYPPSSMDNATCLSTDKAIRALIHTGLRYNQMSVKDNSLFMLIALNEISKDDLSMPADTLVNKVKSENSDRFDLDVASRVVGQVVIKLPVDLRERMTPRQKIAVMTYVNNTVKKPLRGEAFTNASYVGSNKALNNAARMNNVIHASYVDNKPVLHMDARTKELYYYDENSHALLPLSSAKTLDATGVSQEQLEKYLKNHDLSNYEINKILKSVTPTSLNNNNKNNNNKNNTEHPVKKHHKKKVSNNVIIGVSVGVSLFLLLVALLVYFLQKNSN